MSNNLELKLAVILHADVVESTRLVQEHEARAHEGMVNAFKQLSAEIEKFDGDVAEIRGDALVGVFSRASDAVTAAVEFQRMQAQSTDVDDTSLRPELRIGIAMGEVIIADDTVTGAGVVLAQRLEQLCQSGQVIIQGAVYETLPNHLPLDFENLGEKNLKGFDESVRAYRVDTKGSGEAIAAETPNKSDSSIQARGGKPSIAVLPFANHSDDPEQKFFSDGISEDIIAELSRFHSLFVLARNSSFRFRDKDLGIREIGRQLGVQYVVEGSVRRAGSRVRIIAQLIEVENENQVWAERYDRDLEDIFDVQDEVTRSIVAVLPGRIQEDVVDRAARKPTEHMKAYELMLQGKAYRDLLSAEGNAAARECCLKAITIDPRYARAYMYLSDSYIVDVWLGLGEEQERDLAMRHARTAAELDSNDVYIQDHLGYAHLVCGLWHEAEVQFDKTLSKIVNEAESMAWCGYAYLLLGKLEEARDVVLEAMALDPLHPPTLDWILGQIRFFEGKHEEVINLLYGKALLNSVAYAFVTAAHACLGHSESTRLALDSFIAERNREFQSRGIEVRDNTVESLAGAYRAMWKDPTNWDTLAKGLHKAGLPRSGEG